MGTFRADTRKGGAGGPPELRLAGAMGGAEGEGGVGPWLDAATATRGTATAAAGAEPGNGRNKGGHRAERIGASHTSRETGWIRASQQGMSDRTWVSLEREGQRLTDR